MVPIVLPEDIRAVDAWCYRDGGVKAHELMELASWGLTRALVRELSVHGDTCTVLIVAGPGNNGGDGLCVARQLHELRPDLTILVCDVASEGRVSELRSRAHHLLPAAVSVITFEDLTPDLQIDVVVDAIMGIGGNEDLRDPIPNVLAALAQYQARVIALDVPTGLNCATGVAHAQTLHADVTLTISAEKVGFWLCDGPSVTGRIVVVPVGVPDAEKTIAVTLERLTQSDLPMMLPARPRRYSKFDAGRVVVIGGTLSMPGAPSMTAHAALRSGAGLVHLVAPRVHPLTPREIIVHEVPCDVDGAIAACAYDQIASLVERATVVAIGPGVGCNDTTLRMLARVVDSIPDGVPVIIDADGLRLVPMLASLRSTMVLTPHRGEFARMVGCDVHSLGANPIAIARDWCNRHSPILHLKDTPSVTSTDSRAVITVNGSSRMATAGSGDILTGIIAGIIAQGVAPFEGTALAAFVHAEAGSRAAGPHDQPIIATDMLAELPEILAHSPSD